METQILDQLLTLIDLKTVIAIIIVCYWLFEHSPGRIRQYFGYPGAKTYTTMIVAALVSLGMHLIDPLNPVSKVMAYFFATSFYEAILKQIRRQFRGPEV